jgi:hypothetical protein
MSGCNGGIDLNRTILAGVDNATLKKWLTDAQNALNSLMLGTKAIEVTYTQGDGQRSVTYTRTNMQQLTMWIGQIQAQLGVTHGRRPMRPVFSGR